MLRGVESRSSARSPSGHVAAAVEAEQDAQPALAQAVLLGPALLQVVQGASRKAQRAKRLDGAHVDVQGVEQLAHADAVEPALIVPCQLAADPGDSSSFNRVFHSEGLHYYYIQDFGRRLFSRA